MDYILPLQKLIEEFASLKGVGKKTAARYAFSVLAMTKEEADEFASAIKEAKEKITACKICGNLTDADICPICGDDKRDKSVICVVEDARAVLAIEKTRDFDGVYHVLGGVISPSSGIGPDKLRINELINRVRGGNVKELIIATNPNIDGETTALYIARLVSSYNVKTTRLAYGVPVGADIEYADSVTLMRAITGRRDINGSD